MNTHYMETLDWGILIYDKKISNLKDMLPILEPAVQTGRPLLIFSIRLGLLMMKMKNDVYIEQKLSELKIK
ncbi:hypothetical protein D0T50_13585 [Bacteroides sp. 214]|uniref:hypothetical protein n=1 Tax=Bacteroides sp. 214 TaxID=2302935 RepID=UPI0013D88C69|nr:hypothetical protein [Bacteroides sp. 214]NDW13900.1 hypothetical protein [Bacteroides sp. 214]